jgi:uncharacterized protein YlbG (UPF0298 family)
MMQLFEPQNASSGVVWLPSYESYKTLQSYGIVRKSEEYELFVHDGNLKQMLNSEHGVDIRTIKFKMSNNDNLDDIYIKKKKMSNNDNLDDNIYMGL